MPLAVFGEPVWRAFIASIPFTQKIVLERGAINFSTLQSIFGAVRMWGGSVRLAYMLQAGVAIYAGQCGPNLDAMPYNRCVRYEKLAA